MKYGILERYHMVFGNSKCILFAQIILFQKNYRVSIDSWKGKERRNRENNYLLVQGGGILLKSTQHIHYILSFILNFHNKSKKSLEILSKDINFRNIGA